MATFYRIVQAHWADSAMTGEGARLWGGRWNPPGMAAVYLAESRALAALEILVHAPREAIHLEWRAIAVEVPDVWIATAQTADLPADWQALPSSSGARRFGGQWLSAGINVALRLPSVIVPQEHTLLVQPLHPDAAKLRVSDPEVFRFDPRF
jgi:RES domain-containing protein